jgi:hypothetical protein
MLIHSDNGICGTNGPVSAAIKRLCLNEDVSACRDGHGGSESIDENTPTYGDARLLPLFYSLFDGYVPSRTKFMTR